MTIAIDYDVLRNGLQPHLESLKNLDFSYQNPLFWILIFVIFLVFAKIWGARKSFMFSVILSGILLATTAAEHKLMRMLVKPGEAFDPTIIRIFFGVLVAFTILYFAFIKEN